MSVLPHSTDEKTEADDSLTQLHTVQCESVWPHCLRDGCMVAPIDSRSVTGWERGSSPPRLELGMEFSETHRQIGGHGDHVPSMRMEEEALLLWNTPWVAEAPFPKSSQSRSVAGVSVELTSGFPLHDGARSVQCPASSACVSRSVH